jgi:adenylate cyclase
MGAQDLKNISEPMRAWRLSDKFEALLRQLRQATCWDYPISPLPRQPSIAVLPFENMSGDPEQEYFADGMAEEIITALSRFKSLFVIGRNSSFTYKRAR